MRIVRGWRYLPAGVAGVGLGLALCATAFAGVNPRRPAPDAHDRVVEGIIIVKLQEGSLRKGGTASSGLTSSFSPAGVYALTRVFPVERLSKAFAGDTVGLSRIFYGTLAPGVDPRIAAARVTNLPGVEYAEPKYLQELRDLPNDSLFAIVQSAYFSKMRVQDAWSVVKGSPSVVVAVVDGGTFWQHPDLLPNIWVNGAEDANHDGLFETGAPPAGDEDGVDGDGDGFVDDVIGWNFQLKTNNPKGSPVTPGSYAHGTATASHVCAVTNNVMGMAGTSWNCRLMPINAAAVFQDMGIAFGYEGIQFAAAHGARVINCSWGRMGSYSRFEQDVVTAATNVGAVIVAAAGNTSSNNDIAPQYPASLKGVMAVGATVGGGVSGDALASFSTYGISVPVYAPGVDILSALPSGGWGNGGSGTSYSSPLTAGLAALLAVQHPSWTPRQIASQIRVTADPIEGSNAPSLQGLLGHGRVNYYRAVTEGHAGLDVMQVSTRQASGRAYAVTGDTLLVSATLRNILPASASGLVFTLSSRSGSLVVLDGPVTVPLLPSGGEITLPEVRVRVDTVSGSRRDYLRLSWESSGEGVDAVPIGITVFSVRPDWVVSGLSGNAPLFSIKMVDARVAWASGGDGTGANPVVVRTLDGGGTWADVTGNLAGVDLYCVTALDSLRAWVGTQDGRIFATTDGGGTWSNQPYPTPASPFIDGIWFFDASHGYALGDPASGANPAFTVLKTNNGGQTWTHLAAEPLAASGESGWNNSFWWTDPNHGWFGTNKNSVLRTTDGGETWASAPTGSENSVGVAFSNAMTGAAVHTDGVVSWTTDGGLTWNPTGGFATTLPSIAAAPGDGMLWTTDGLTIWMSRNGGQSWAAQNVISFSGSLFDLSMADTAHGLAATSFGGALSYVSSESTGSPIPPRGIPSQMTVAQNYPNPFNATTRINYTLPLRTAVAITVYDLLGREVAVLRPGVQNAGAQSLLFDAHRLASGVYFYRVEAGGAAELRKMVLLK